MRLTMNEKKSITKLFLDRYRYASKHEKMLILNELMRGKVDELGKVFKDLGDIVSKIV